MHVHSIAVQSTYPDPLAVFDVGCWIAGGYTATLVLSGRSKEGQIQKQISLRGKRVRIMEGQGPRRTEYMEIKLIHQMARLHFKCLEDPAQ